MKLLLLFCTLLATVIPAPSNPDQAPSWDAQWIWQPETGPANAWVAFRKKFTPKTIPEQVTARIATDTKFWLWINGNLVVFEGGLARGPSPARPWDRKPEMWKLPPATKPTDSWYDDVEISDYLKPGENTIAILVWYWGRETHKGMHIDSGQGGLLFEADVAGQRIVSDASWKALQHPAFGFDIKIDENVVAYPVKFDARKALGDWTDAAWQQPGFDSDAWPAAVAKGKPPVAPWYRPVMNPVPRLVDYGLKDYPADPEAGFPFVSDGTEIRCNLPFNKQITPYLDVEAEAGQEIFITTDNRLNRITATYITRAGRQAFESYSWMNGHTVIYQIPAGVKVFGLKYRWQSVGEMAGSFSCDDPFYQRLWEMGRNTLFVCARDNFMDCPDRERALWIGDVADQAGYLFYLMDGSGRALLRKAIYSTMAFSDKGVFGALGPLRIRELPSQSLQFISQGVWQYYLNTGDKETLRYAYPYAQDYLALWKFSHNGLPIMRRSGSSDSWDWYDWGVKDTEDKEVIQCALYYQALAAARTMAMELGETRDVAGYDKRLASIRAAFEKAYWQDGYYSSKPGKLQDDRANAAAILAGLASPEQAALIVKRVLIPNHYCSPHFEWMVEEAMCQAGFPREALDRMKTRYATQVKRKDLTTLYESFPNGGSYNHAWNAPNSVLAKCISGIVPTKPGWTEFAVKPQPLHLASLQQTVPSVRGEIHFALRRDAHCSTLTLQCPAGTTAIVGLPLDRGPIARVTANGTVIWDSGRAVPGLAGVTALGADATHLSFQTSPGDWKFEATN